MIAMVLRYKVKIRRAPWAPVWSVYRIKARQQMCIAEFRDKRLAELFARTWQAIYTTEGR